MTSKLVINPLCSMTKILSLQFRYFRFNSSFKTCYNLLFYFNQDDVIFMPMVNKYGQKYHCLLPKQEEIKELNAKDDANENELEGAKEEVVELTGVSKARKLLEPMSQNCLFKTKDWWTYEFCYGRTVKQFHMEGTVFILSLRPTTFRNVKVNIIKISNFRWQTIGQHCFTGIL